MTPRSVGGITIRPENNRGLYYFMSLEKGIIVNVRQWNVIHVTESVMGRVKQLSVNEVINERVDGYILF